MSSRTRRVLFWLTFLAFAAACAVWTVYIPHNPGQLLRAVPGSATVITLHDGLAARWDGIDDHPVVELLGGLAGMEPDALTDLSGDPGFRYILDLAAGRELITAYLPFAGASYEPTWVLASWIGGRSHRLRWLLPFMKIDGLERIGESGGWPLWVYRWEDDGKSGEITLAMVEGILIGCLSRDPRAIDTVIDAYNGLYPSVASRGDLQEWITDLFGSKGPDRVWFKHELSRTGFAGSSLIDFELDPAARAGGTVRLAAPEVRARQDEPVLPGALLRFWQGAPAAALIADAASLYQLDDLPRQAWLDMLLDTVRVTGARAAAVGLFAEDYSGRFKGIRIPSAMAAVQVPPGTGLREAAQQLTDRWNAEYRWGVVPVLYRAGTAAVYRVEGISGGFYASLPMKEQAAFCMVDDWLVLSSSLQALESMLSARESGQTDPADWTASAEQAFAGGEQAFLYGDLERLNRALRLAIDAYSLKLLFEDPMGSGPARQQLSDAKVWMDTAARLRQLTMAGRVGEDRIRIEFNAGP